MNVGAFFISMVKTAILVDGGFYRRMISKARGSEEPEVAADTLFRYCQAHLHNFQDTCSLYRVLYYDCAPSDKQVYHPLLEKVVNLKIQPQYQWNMAFLEALRSKRKFALRLGKLAGEQAHYNLRPDVTKALLAKKRTIDSLTEQDFSLSIKQKGVDTRIGIDIVAMALKQQVERIILIAGDSDFVPAAKFARREGVDVILDAMGASIKHDLGEHIDGLKTVLPSFTISEQAEAKGEARA